MCDTNIIVYIAYIVPTRPPTIELRDYLHRVLKYACCSGECFILALIYIDRLIATNPSFIVNSLNIHRLLITAVMLAAKFFDDQYFNNVCIIVDLIGELISKLLIIKFSLIYICISQEYFAKIGGISTDECDALELDLLFMINFTLYVNTDTYLMYHTELTNHTLNTSNTCNCHTITIPIVVFNTDESITNISDSTNMTNDSARIINDSNQQLSSTVIYDNEYTNNNINNHYDSHPQSSYYQPQSQPHPFIPTQAYTHDAYDQHNQSTHIYTDPTMYHTPHIQQQSYPPQPYQPTQYDKHASHSNALHSSQYQPNPINAQHHSFNDEIFNKQSYNNPYTHYISHNPLLPDHINDYNSHHQNHNLGNSYTRVKSTPNLQINDIHTSYTTNH